MKNNKTKRKQDNDYTHKTRWLNRNKLPPFEYFCQGKSRFWPQMISNNKKTDGYFVLTPLAKNNSTQLNLSKNYIFILNERWYHDRIAKTNIFIKFYGLVFLSNTKSSTK